MALIRHLRQSAGITQQQLAAQVGLSVGAIRDIEQGRVTSPRRDSACRLAEALGLDATDSIAEAITADRAGEVVSSGMLEITHRPAAGWTASRSTSSAC